MPFTSLITESVDKINKTESRKKSLAGKLSGLREENLLKLGSKELLEEKFVQKVKETELNHRIAGIDSGFVGKRLYSLDIVLIRAVGAVFDYEKSKVKEVQYHPNAFSFPNPFLSSNDLENDEFLCNKSLLRLKEEVRTATEMIEKFSPQYCFLDGSIVPQYADKPRKDSRLNSVYREMLELFQNLYSAADKKNCALIGAVEDSRGSRLRNLLQREVLSKKAFVDSALLDNLFDSSLLQFLLQKGERSFAFHYSGSIGEHAILKDFDSGWAERIHALYLKPCTYDRPLRIEFLADNGSISKKADEAAKVAMKLSCMHREYAYPAVLIEADLRARLHGNEVETVFNKILDKLGKESSLFLRRDSRPFS